MNKRKIQEAISTALSALGVNGKVRVVRHDRWTLDVYVDGKHFGLWDITKNTFVG